MSEQPGPPEELNESQCLDLLRQTPVGRLAVRFGERGVDIFPINFVVDHGTVLFCTAAGHKLDDIDAEPSVAFEADHFDWNERTAWSVVIKGTASVVTNREEILELLEIELDSWQHDRKPYYVRVVPTTTTGRRFRLRRPVDD